MLWFFIMHRTSDIRAEILYICLTTYYVPCLEEKPFGSQSAALYLGISTLHLYDFASAYGCMAAAALSGLTRSARGQATSDASLCSGFTHTLQARYCRVSQRGAHVSM